MDDPVREAIFLQNMSDECDENQIPDLFISTVTRGPYVRVNNINARLHLT